MVRMGEGVGTRRGLCRGTVEGQLPIASLCMSQEQRRGGLESTHMKTCTHYMQDQIYTLCVYVCTMCTRAHAHGGRCRCAGGAKQSWCWYTYLHAQYIYMCTRAQTHTWMLGEAEEAEEGEGGGRGRTEAGVAAGGAGGWMGKGGGRYKEAQEGWERGRVRAVKERAEGRG